MVNHTQTVRLSVFDHFVGLALKGLTVILFVSLFPVSLIMIIHDVTKRFFTDSKKYLLVFNWY